MILTYRNAKEIFFCFNCLGMLWPKDLGIDPQRLFVEAFGMDILPSLLVVKTKTIIIKTAKCYGEQKVDCPPVLKLILNKWIKKNPTNWLLFDSNMNPLSSVKLNQRINKIFDGKKVGVNNLRHSYLTEKYGSTIEQKKEIENDMKNMGSSPAMLTNYVKS